ncbi:surfactin synthase thioesterase subunit [Cytobacillus horneckiae]|uniref:thioesterase II family protein n=1 Tax=Cytobacillus horneckiae TaxID=549687 RepID=UPI001562C19A|nr:thioesterase [Cytobacillus horneckiae]MBN6889315.1 thioesterase [Cytobacillus horneckiae]NRG43283.1 thioesterase [Bacillus sp. CRN 9]
MRTNNAKKSKWFLREPSSKSKARLFCLPYSGCGASMYRDWPQFIGDVEICPIQFPGRENRFSEDSFTSYEALSEELIENLLPYFDRPFSFFGHCASSLPGYEISKQLKMNGHPEPSHLFISSQVAPHDGPCGRFLTMSDEELYEELKNLIIKMGGTPIPDLLELNLGVLRSDINANKKYKPQQITNLEIPITVISWDNDIEVKFETMGGWREYGETQFQTLQGDHYTFLDAPAELLDIISSKILVK